MQPMRTPKLRTELGLIEIPDGWLEEDEQPHIRRRRVKLAKELQPALGVVIQFEPRHFPPPTCSKPPRPIMVAGKAYYSVFEASQATGRSCAVLYRFASRKPDAEIRFITASELEG